MEQEEIKERQKEILTESLLRLDNLLTMAENLEIKNPNEKWLVHQSLLEEIPLLEKLLTLCEYHDTEQIINRVKKIANNVAPASSSGCYV